MIDLGLNHLHQGGKKDPALVPLTFIPSAIGQSVCPSSQTDAALAGRGESVVQWMLSEQTGCRVED